MVRGSLSTAGNEAKTEYFPKMSGRYVLLIADKVGDAGNTSGYFCCAELNLLDASSRDKDIAQQNLQRVITAAEPYAAATGIGYGDAAFQKSLTTAQTAVEGTDAEAMVTAKTALENAMVENISVPETGKYYYIVSTLKAFETNQSVKKAMYGAADSKVYWTSIDKNDAKFYWTVSPSATSTSRTKRYYVSNAYVEKSMKGFTGDHLVLDNDANVEFSVIAPGEFNIKLAGNTCHAFGHSNGNGTGSRVSSYPAAANSASAWTFVEATSEEVANALNAYSASFDAIVAKYADKNATNPTTMNWVTTDAYNTYKDAVDAFKADPAFGNIAAIEAAYDPLLMSKVMPVFTITNCRPGTLNKAIIETNENGMNTFTTIAENNKDGRLYWAIDFESNTAKTGEFRAYNLLSKKNLRSRDGQANVIKVEMTNNAAVTDQFIITQNGGSPLHAEAATGNVVTWDDRAPNDGSAWKINYVGTTVDMPVEALQAYKNSVIPFYTECQTIKNRSRYTNELNGYTFTGLEGGFDAVAAHEATFPATVEGINNFCAFINSCSNAINQPADGSFIRVRNIKGNTDAAKRMVYLLGTNSTVEGQATRAGFQGATNNTTTVFYYKNGKLLSYASGEYLANNSTFAGFAGVNEGTTVSFNKSKNINQGTYIVGFNGAEGRNRMLYARQEGYSDAGGFDANTTDEGYQYWLESVTALDVNVKAYSFATLNSPVALTIPETVTAVYTGKKDASGNYLVLTPLTGTIPANTPVIVEAAEGNHTFNISSEAGTSVEDNDLQGTVASENVSGSVLTLQNIDAPGFYTYTGSVLKGFKAYLNGASEIRGFIIDETTGITAPDSNTAKSAATIYDLSGRRVNKAGKGIYIVNGKKVVLD